MPVAKSVTILTNGEKLVENRDEAIDKLTIETRGIEKIVGDERVEGITLKKGTKIPFDGLFVAVRNSI